MCMQYSTRSLLASYKVCNFIVCVQHCMLWLFIFCEDQVFMDFVGFLSMIICEVWYTRYLGHIICSAWFLGIRISTCLYCRWKFSYENLKPWAVILRNSSHKWIKHLTIPNAMLLRNQAHTDLRQGQCTPDLQTMAG